MTPNKLPPLQEPHITDGNHILFPCGGRGYWGFSPEQVQAITGPLQAKIDALMLEYCPDEMTPEQMATWAAHQVPMPAAEAAEVAEALRQSQSLPAVAVAGLARWWSAVEREDAKKGVLYDDAAIIATHTGGFGNLHLTAGDIRAALQADAREKGSSEKMPVSANAEMGQALATQPAQASEKDNG